MSKDDGLISRMVRFVRNPTVNWSDLDQVDSDSESRYSKQMLKDMIERRRRNDFVRKREFDMLRKLRRDNMSGAPDGTVRPSFFQSSISTKPDERAKTIKKIDEIEAQMSQQWWKTKLGDPKGDDESPENPNTDFSLSIPDQISPSDFGGVKPQVTRPPSRPRRPVSGYTPAAETSHFKSTVPQDLGESAQPAGVIRASQIGGIGGSFNGDVTGFTHSKLNAVQVGEFAHDPLLEEAAIRFANGDDDGAESALLEALRNPDPAINGNEAIWMTLFDLYRATDRQDSFENVSLDFANRFGRTAPMWFSIPGSMRKHVPAHSESSSEMEPHWRCPEVLDLQSLATLSALVERLPQPWCLGWSTLVSIDDGVLEPLLRLFTQWTNKSVKLRFWGSEHLLDVLKLGTVTDDRTVNPLRWRLRMETLRIMHRPDEFEVVALDYCVTYEVSPPSWDGALCDFKALDGMTGPLSRPPTIIADSGMDGGPSTIPTDDFTDTDRSALEAHGAHVSVVDLSGHIMGDAVEMLEALNAKLEGSDLIVVLCARLVRLDFLAAGTLLNWVSARQAEGRQIQFKDLHRLVAVFFNVIGINEHARVLARKD